MKIFNGKKNFNIINSPSICNEDNNTYGFDFEKGVSLSGLSFISNNGDVQISEFLSMTCTTGQNKDTKSIEVRFFHIFSLNLKISRK